MSLGLHCNSQRSLRDAARKTYIGLAKSIYSDSGSLYNALRRKKSLEKILRKGDLSDLLTREKVQGLNSDDGNAFEQGYITLLLFKE